MKQADATCTWLIAYNAYSTISLEIAWAYKSAGCASKLSFAWKIQQLKEQKMLGARKVHKLHVNISESPMRNSDCRAGMNFRIFIAHSDSLPNKKVDLRQSNPHNLLHGWSLRHVGIVFAMKANWSNVHLMRIETDARPVRVFADCMFPSVFVHLFMPVPSFQYFLSCCSQTPKESVCMCNVLMLSHFHTFPLWGVHSCPVSYSPGSSMPASKALWKVREIKMDLERFNRLRGKNCLGKVMLNHR